MNKLNRMLLTVLLFALANTWGRCVIDLITISIGSLYACNSSGCSGSCQYKATCETAYQAAVCPETKSHSGYIYTEPLGVTSMGFYINGTGRIFSCPSTSTGCFEEVSPSNGAFYWGCKYNLRCDTQREADSVSCVRNGETWHPNGYCIKDCHSEACCDSLNTPQVSIDSIYIWENNACTLQWRCDSVLTKCNERAGTLFGDVLPDTSVSGQDTTFSYQCFYNCAYSPNPDSTVYLVEGNTVLAGPSDSIADGIKSEWFSSIRTTTGSIYVYDYLSPAASEYIDSIAAMKCVEHLWRCVINNKYVYWYDNQEVPAGCTNIVRVK